MKSAIQYTYNMIKRYLKSGIELLNKKSRIIRLKVLNLKELSFLKKE
jgi:hypothetical protein